MKFKRIALFAAIAAVTIPAASASVEQPNPAADSLNGQLSLTSGFNPDPRVISVTAGGTIPGSSVGRNCAGFVAANPDFKLNYTAGDSGLPLIISVASSADTTLVINGPDNQWYCDDDGGQNGSNPSVRFNHPASGRYDIFVGTYASGTPAPARLHISELTSQ
jgi:hypothetical protein